MVAYTSMEFDNPTTQPKTLPRPEEEQKMATTTTTTAALIGAIGLVLGTVVSNVDDIYQLLSGTKTITAEYSGYQPTGVFETELRYYYEVTGLRVAVVDLQERLIDSQVTLLTAEFPEDREEIERIANAVREESPQVSELIDVVVPIFEKYFTVEEIQELNRFYSTEIMQGTVSKQRLVNAEAAPILAELQQDLITRVTDNFNRSTLESILRR